MMGILQNISRIRANRTTYRAGLLQAKAYRILKQTTAEILSPLGISTVEWGLLGFLVDNPRSRFQEIAFELGVEPPFVTVLAKHLIEMEVVMMEHDDDDSRVKTLSLSDKGKRFVVSTESTVRSQIRHLVSGASPRDLLGYLAVLETIIKNAPAKKLKKALT